MCVEDVRVDRKISSMERVRRWEFLGMCFPCVDLFTSHSVHAVIDSSGCAVFMRDVVVNHHDYRLLYRLAQCHTASSLSEFDHKHPDHGEGVASCVRDAGLQTRSGWWP